MEKTRPHKKKLKFSLILPAYNEEFIITENLEILYDYLKGLEEDYTFEMLVINDGSKDRTGELADAFAKGKKEVRILHHPVNLNLGTALQTGFNNAKGELIITYDLDLSYGPQHNRNILETYHVTKADVVIASPYMKGGKVTAVPYFRKMMSKWANRLMKLAAQQKFYTFTCMVRGYRKEFIERVNLKAANFEINPEILYKAMILRARMIEIPAHLDWSGLKNNLEGRKSGIRILGTLVHSLMAGFMLRPYGFFLTIGTALLIVSLYIIVWIFINTLHILPEIQVEQQFFDDRFSAALGEAFRERPHAFLLGGITLIASIQFISLGFISLQNKRYFEELFHISASLPGRFSHLIKNSLKRENQTSNGH